MAADFPYTHYACPCSDLTSNAPASLSNSNSNQAAAIAQDETFDPHDPRANYSLFPLDQLLYCDECDAIRCPRCWVEEVIAWYCPSCLFEVPSSAVKSDGNRCSRNCYDCPLCSSPLSITAVSGPSDSGNLLKPPNATSEETHILQCQYCNWTSLDVGVQLAKPSKVTEQLARMRQARRSRTMGEPNDSDQREADSTMLFDPDTAFANLLSFYKEQLSETSDPQNPYSNSPYSSPANLARIMSLYGGLSYNALKKSREKPQPMREAGNQAEGKSSYSTEASQNEDDILDQMETMGWEATADLEQRFAAPVNFDARLSTDLWPVARALRTRRGKRCKTCRQFLIRPESKIGVVRYRIRLLAVNFAPRLLLRPLNPGAPYTQPSFRLRPEPLEQDTLRPHVAQQYVLTVRNPIFEPIRVTLATPALTPGKVSSRVTILCPSFTVGPAGDVWDEALGNSQSAPNDGGRKAAMASLTGSADTDRQPEAGKIWDKTRSSTSVILEVTPGSLEPPLSVIPKSEEQMEKEALQPGDETLEIPIYVRVEWEAHVDESGLNKEKKLATAGANGVINKELGYWCVLGVGRIV